MVAEGRFRLDLFYRINVMSIKSPSLADHPEDIPALADCFVNRYADLFAKKITGIEPAAMALLQRYDWPGNVRELENIIQSAIVCSDGEIIEAKDLPEQFRESPPGSVDKGVSEVGSFERQLRDFKIKLATRAIEECNGNKTLAARKLNISRAYLHRLVRNPDDTDVSDVA